MVISRVITRVTPFRALITLLITYLLTPNSPAPSSSRQRLGRYCDTPKQHPCHNCARKAMQENLQSSKPSSLIEQEHFDLQKAAAPARMNTVDVQSSGGRSWCPKTRNPKPVNLKPRNPKPCGPTTATRWAVPKLGDPNIVP